MFDLPIHFEPPKPVTPDPATLPSSGVSPQTLAPSQVQQLATRYAPIVYLHPDEKNSMEDPLRYIQDSSLRKERDFWPDKELHGVGDVPPGELPQYQDRDTFLDHGDSDAARGGDPSRAKMLYEYDADKNVMTYHLFYAYNDGFGPQNHEGDWEAVSVKLDSNYQPTDVYYSGHGGATHRTWADAPTEDGRPVTLAALGSHANVPGEGAWKTAFPGVLDHAVKNDDSVRIDLAEKPAIDVTTQPYYGSGIGWGERGSAAEVGITDTSGPTGPSPAKIAGIEKAIDESSDKQPVESFSLGDLLGKLRPLLPIVLNLH